MFIYSLPEKEGMLFKFEKEKIIKIWMKNTYIPLDIIWLDKNYTIQKIEYNTIPLSLTTLYHPKKSNFVIEINAGKAKKLNLKVNQQITLKNIIQETEQYHQYQNQSFY